MPDWSSSIHVDASTNNRLDVIRWVHIISHRRLRCRLPKNRMERTTKSRGLTLFFFFWGVNEQRIARIDAANKG